MTFLLIWILFACESKPKIVNRQDQLDFAIYEMIHRLPIDSLSQDSLLKRFYLEKDSVHFAKLLNDLDDDFTFRQAFIKGLASELDSTDTKDSLWQTFIKLHYDPKKNQELTASIDSTKAKKRMRKIALKLKNKPRRNDDNR